MKILTVLPLYLLSVFLLLSFFLLGIFVGTRFTLSLMMEVLGYPTGVAAVFPKVIALIGGVGGSFWGLLLVVALIRFLGHHWIGSVKFGERPILNTTMSAFLTFVFILLVLITVFGERLSTAELLKILLET